MEWYAQDIGLLVLYLGGVMKSLGNNPYLRMKCRSDAKAETRACSDQMQVLYGAPRNCDVRDRSVDF